MTYRFVLNETSYHGPGAIAAIGPEVERRGFKKALIVTDQGLVKGKVIDQVTDLLKKDGHPYEVFDQVVPNPTVAVVKAGVECFKKSGADYLIAIGGGSPQDVAKAIGIIHNNPEYADVVSLEGLAPTKHKCVPIIAVPTTAGTAAEVTINYVITDEAKRRKFVCVDPHDIPVIAVVDPNMMSGMPPGLTAATGLDALTHAIESTVTPGAWELSDTLNLKAVEIISDYLRSAFKNEPEGRRMMALAQYMTGMAFSNVGLGLVHGMAHPLGAFYNTPHGLANAVLLPYVMEFNAEFTGEKYRAIGKAMGVAEPYSRPLEQVRSECIRVVAKLAADLDIPKTLKEIDVKEADLEALSEAAMADVCTGGNPRPCTKELVWGVYRQAYSG